MNASELTFGVEIETTIPAGAIVVGGYHTGAPIPGFPAGWTAQHDGSIRRTRGRTGCEFVSPVLKGAEGIAQLIGVIAALKAMGGQVNDSGGFHVHGGVSRADRAAHERLVHLTSNFETALYAATGTRRRERGMYCRSVRGNGSVDRTLGAGRYQLLNSENLLRGTRPTVEFRVFAATLNPGKAVAYVRLCLAMVERATVTTRKTQWQPKPTSENSPMKRKGEGSTQLTRLMYRLGWTRGQAKQVFGQVVAPGLPTMQASKRALLKLAKKYDAAP